MTASILLRAKTLTAKIVCSTLCTAAVIVAPASAATKSGQYTASFGNSNGACSIRVNADLITTSNSATGAAAVTGDVTMLGQTLEAARIIVGGAAGPTGVGSSGTVYVAGSVVWSQSAGTTTTFAQNISLDMFGTKPKRSFKVGPVTVMIEGQCNAFAGVSTTFWLDAFQPAVALTGKMYTSATGNASASVGVHGYKVSLSSSLGFAVQELTMHSTATPAAITGGMDYVLYDGKFNLKAIVKAWPFTWQKEIFSYGYPGVMQSLL